MLLASKGGDITLAKLISQDESSWTLEIEMKVVVVEKTGEHKLCALLSEAYIFASAPEEDIEYAKSLEAGEGNSVSCSSDSPVA